MVNKSASSALHGIEAGMSEIAVYEHVGGQNLTLKTDTISTCTSARIRSFRRPIYIRFYNLCAH